MPGPIALDTKHWIRVVPTGRTQVVTARGFACFYSTLPEAPEVVTEATELAKDSSVTLKTSAPLWFRGKIPATTEEPFQPSTLEVGPANPESTGTAQLGEEAVTPTQAKSPSTLPTFKTGKGEQNPGTSAIARQVAIALTAKETEKAYKKVKHGLKNEYPQVAVYKESTKTLMKLAKVVAENTEELEIEIEATIADKEAFYVVVTG